MVVFIWRFLIFEDIPEQNNVVVRVVSSQRPNIKTSIVNDTMKSLFVPFKGDVAVQDIF
jgi:hypothetical protein